MTDGDGNRTSQAAGMTLGEGLDLLDAANRRVTYRGYNSLEVKQLRRISAEQWAGIRAEYRVWIKEMRVFGLWGPFVCLAVAVVCFYFLHGWMRTTAGVVGALALFAIGRLEGHREGYEDGYSNG